MKIVSLSENTTGTSSSNNNTTTSSGSGTGSGNDTFGDEITDNNKLNRESHNNSSSGENNGCGDVNISEEDNNNNNSIQDGGCYFEQVENKKFHVNKKQISRFIHTHFLGCKKIVFHADTFKKYVMKL